jgi:hypothetical protein
MTARTAEAGLNSVRTVQLAPTHEDPSQLREHIHAPIAFDTPSIDEDAVAGAWQARGSHPRANSFRCGCFATMDQRPRYRVARQNRLMTSARNASATLHLDLYKGEISGPQVAFFYERLHLTHIADPEIRTFVVECMSKGTMDRRSQG